MYNIFSSNKSTNKSFVPRTEIRIQYPKITKEKGKVSEKIDWIDIGNSTVEEENQYIFCEWKNAHGLDIASSSQELGVSKATIRLIYDDRIDSRCRVIKCNNNIEKIYKIIGEPDNIGEQNHLMEIYLERMVQS